MGKIKITEFIEHVNTTVGEIKEKKLEEQIQFCKSTPIRVIFNGKDVEIPNNADSITSLIEMTKNGLEED